MSADVENIRSKYIRALEATRRDPDLNDQAKRSRIAAAYEEARVAMERLRQTAAQESEETGARLYKKAFGQTFDSLTPHDERVRSIQISRDSLDRTERLESPQDALRLLSRAELTGDSYLTKAIALKSYEMRWVDVLNEIERVRPAVGNAVAALHEHESAQSPQNDLGLHMAMSLNRPPEI
jgi:hypothetical protein